MARVPASKRTVPIPAAEPDPLPVPASSLAASFRWGWYTLSFLVPFAGIFIALFLYDREPWEVRRVGRNCLFIGFLVWVVVPFAVLVGLVFMGALALAGAASNLMGPY